MKQGAPPVDPDDAGPPLPPFRWKVSNIIREVPIDGIQMVDDVPVKLHGVLVKGRLADVMEELVVHFVRSGLYMQPVAKQDQLFRQLQVTALDHERAISYTAMIDALADGTCMVVLGEANIAQASAGLARKGPSDFAPLMPQAVSPTRVSTEGLRTISFSVNAREIEVRQFYQERLKQAGYAEGEPNLFRRNNEEIVLSMKREKSRLDVLLTSRVAPGP